VPKIVVEIREGRVGFLGGDMEEASALPTSSGVWEVLEAFLSGKVWNEAPAMFGLESALTQSWV